MDNIPPSENEFELTLFGTGYGECILVHALENKWIIIDSCINPVSRKIAALEYLESIGVEASTQVEMLVVSHWHEDHIKGLNEICRLCSDAEIVLSQAMGSKEFLRFVNVVNQRKIYSYAGKSTDEIKKILETVLKKKSSGEFRVKWASADKPLYSKKINDELPIFNMISLSPLDHSITSASIEMAKKISASNTEITVQSATNPNHFAIVLWVSIGDTHILLGSDLEERAHPKGAWTVIANNENRHGLMADVFKVPHHGSENAYCKHVYDNMLTDKHLSVLTPFTWGKVTLPGEADIARLKEQKCSDIFMACRSSGKNTRHNSVVEKILKESTKSRKTLNSFGYITLRKNVSDGNSDWQIFTKGQAHKL
ncbi:MAG: MBL fold metallo-hydrolase [Desulfococcaceae bacterium]|nr:MBL fold metallo-hydrolase [Desulfococcaceae bacterium]